MAFMKSEEEKLVDLCKRKFQNKAYLNVTDDQLVGSQFRDGTFKDLNGGQERKLLHRVQFLRNSVERFEQRHFCPISFMNSSMSFAVPAKIKSSVSLATNNIILPLSLRRMNICDIPRSRSNFPSVNIQSSMHIIHCLPALTTPYSYFQSFHNAMRLHFPILIQSCGGLTYTSRLIGPLCK